MSRSKILYRISLSIFFPFTFIFPSQADDNVGTTAFNFLKIGVGARAIGMGEAFTAIVDDATASYWNPAGLSQLMKAQFSVMHLEWFQGIRYESIEYAQPLKNFGRIGIGSSLLSSGGIPRTVEEGGRYYEIGTFSAADILGLVSYAKSIKEELNLKGDLSLGVNLKILHQRIDVSSTWGFATDIGGLYEFPASALERLRKVMIQYLRHELELNKITVGIVVQNLGPKAKFSDKVYSLPFKVRLGSAAKLLNNNLTLAFDINIPNDSRTNIHVGGEYWITNILAIRTGYKTGSGAGSLASLCAGIGIKLTSSDKFNFLELDYAFVPYGSLGQSHRISILVEF